MRIVDFPSIVEQAWKAYAPNRPIQSITDISVRVSTNHVYKIQLSSRRWVFAKLSYFGKYAHFKEDHNIIYQLGRALEPPYEHFLAESYLQGEEVYTYCHVERDIPVWVVFYRPIKTRKRLPKRLDSPYILQLGRELARFHRACAEVRHLLPPSSKTLRSDIQDLLALVHTEVGQFEYRSHVNMIVEHCELFLQNLDQAGYEEMLTIPVFVDWNSGNFSVTAKGGFFSRWDYDWFRVCTRVLDFYFFSRVVSDGGDKTVFSYLADPMMEDRFLEFLKRYHAEFPLTEAEVRFIPEAYRFFILHYVIKFGRHFFHSFYATRLQKEAYQEYLPSLARRFDIDKLLRALDM